MPTPNLSPNIDDIKYPNDFAFYPQNNNDNLIYSINPNDDLVDKTDFMSSSELSLDE